MGQMTEMSQRKKTDLKKAKKIKAEEVPTWQVPQIHKRFSVLLVIII